MLSTPSLRDSSKNAFETVPIFDCLAHKTSQAAKYSKTHDNQAYEKHPHPLPPHPTPSTQT